MGSYRGKVTDDVIGFTPSTPSRTEYGAANYREFSKKSTNKPINKLKHRLDELLDNDPFIENLLYFDGKKYMPIEYDENYLINPNFKISFDSNNSRESDLWKNIKLKNEKNILDFEFSNIYMVFGLIEYEDYIFPLFFIPVNFVEKDSIISFYRNMEFNIQLNYCINDELSDFPSFNDDLIEFINQIDKLENIQFLRKAYIGNFNLNSNTCCNVLAANLNDSLEKFDLFFNNQYFFDSDDIIKLNNKLALKWPDLDFKLNNLNKDNCSVLIKNLLDDGKSILFVFDKFQRDYIKNELFLSNLDDLILDYSMLSENKFYELISDEYPINNEIMEEYLKLNDEMIEIEDCIEVLNKKYSQLNLLPKDLKRFKQKYYEKIKDIPHDFPIKNAKTYKSNYINNLKKQLVEVINNIDIKDIKIYLPDDFFNSSDYNIFKHITTSFETNLDTFININEQVNEIYGIKIFENLSEVEYLANLKVLDKSNKFIEEIDRIDLNNFLKIKLKPIVDINDNIESINKVLDKYEIFENHIENIDNFIKYSELIDLNIFKDEEVLKSNLSVVMKDLEILSGICSYLLKQLDYVHEFYDMFKCFEMPIELSDSKKSINDVHKIINIFKHDFERLENFNDVSEDDIRDINVKNYLNHWKSGEIEKEFVEYVFSYNLYNSILNSFLDENDNIDEEKIISSYYKNRYEKILSEIKKKESDQFKQSIYLKLQELNQNKKVKSQKIEWKSRISDGELIPVREALASYKDYIISNKRIFMINTKLIPLILDKTFENYFDYALISLDADVDDIYYLPVFLRTKNKLIAVAKGVR